MTETFGLTGVELDELERPKIRLEKVQDESQEIQQVKKPPLLRQRILSQESLVKKGVQLQAIQQKKQNFQDKLPKLNLSKTQGKVRSQSTQQMTSLNKFDGLRTALDPIQKTQSSIVSNPMPSRLFSQRLVPQSAQNFLEKYKSQIQSEYDQLYSSRDYTQIIKQVKGFEKKQVMQEHIEKQQQLLQKEMGLANQIEYQIKAKEKQIESLKNQIEQFRRQEEQPQEVSIYTEKLKKFFQLESQLEKMKLQQETLSYMSKTRKDEVIFQKKKCQKLQLELEALNEDMNIKEKFYKNFYSDLIIKNLQSKVEKLSENREQKEANISEKLKDQVEAELEDYENQQAMEQIFIHEDNLRREREEEKRKRKEEEFKRVRAEQEQANKEVIKEYKKIERQIQRERERFEELQKVTRVNDVNSIIEHKQFLLRNKQNLQKFQTEYQQKIQAEKEEIQALQKKRKELIYEQKEGQSDESLLDKIAEVERKLQNEEEQVKELNKKISKKQMCLDQMCLSISRIIFQINSKSAQNSALLTPNTPNAKQVNAEVKREDLEEKINYCSLILERIHAILSKNNIDSIKVESVNTDFNNNAPPRYLGISQHRVQPMENSEQPVIEQNIMNDDSQNVAEVRELLKSQQSTHHQ